VLDQIGAHHRDDQINLAIDRNGQQMTFQITLKSAADPNATESSAPIQFVIGVTAVDAPAGYPPGAFVTGVQGPSAAAGLRSGDEITAIDSIKVRNTTDLGVGVLICRAGLSRGKAELASGQRFRAPFCIGPGGATGRERVVGDARSD
jgi:hypothetical protein